MKYTFIAEEYKEQIARLGLDSVQRWIDLSGRLISTGRTTKLYRLNPPAGSLPTCCAKVYFYPQWDDRIRILCRGGLIGTSRAETEFRNLQTLHRRGLAPRVIACGHQRLWGLLYTSLLVTEEVRQAVSLDRFVADSLSALTQGQRRRFLTALAEFTRRMNAGRFVNGQYHWRNILVRAQDDQFIFQVIDPSSSRLRYRLMYPLYDLATLDVCAPYFFTRSERLAFFKSYQNTANRPLTRRQKKQLFKIAALREKIAKKEMKRYQFILPTNK
jgi:hypothetical protein